MTISIGQTIKNSERKEISLSEICEDGKIARPMLMKSTLVKETEVTGKSNKSVFKDKLRAKLLAEEIEPLKENKRFKALYEKMNDMWLTKLPAHENFCE